MDYMDQDRGRFKYRCYGNGTVKVLKDGKYYDTLVRDCCGVTIYNHEPDVPIPNWLKYNYSNFNMHGVQQESYNTLLKLGLIDKQFPRKYDRQKFKEARKVLHSKKNFSLSKLMSYVES